MPHFMSDNVTCACPEVLEALIASNSNPESSYGEDTYSQRLEAILKEIFETDLVVFPVITGTASNALALSAITPPFGKIYCHELSHINTDECGAPELFTHGGKLVPIKGENVKFTADDLAAQIFGAGNVHSSQPAAVSLTQACEGGSIYQLEEIAAIAKVGHDHGLNVHMDGARFTNALVTLGCTPAEMTWKSGIDVLSFGGTKNGCFAAEVIVFFKTDLAQDFEYLHKRSGQLLSKMRFISAQLIGYLENDVWIKNARHANAMATRLSDGLAAIDGIKLAYPTQSNEVFVTLSDKVIKGIKKDGFDVNEGELDGTAARFVTAWSTNPEKVDELLSIVKRHA